MSITIELPTPDKTRNSMLVIPNDGTRVYRFLCYHRCGKDSCKACKTGKGHGPYWHAYWRIRKDGQVRQVNKYLGKFLPLEEA